MNKLEANKKKVKETYNILSDIFQVNTKLNVIRKIIYVTTVFLGFTLTWYGVYTLITTTWPLNIPIVAIVLGIALLYLNGKTSDLA